MEREDERATLGADEMDLSRWEAMQAQEEREAEIEAALDECLEKGVSRVSLKALAREAGAVHWALKNSLRKD